MFGLAQEQLTAIGVIAGVISTVVAVSGLPLVVLGWRDHLIRELTVNPTRRYQLGRALQATRFVESYKQALALGIGKIDSWIAGYNTVVPSYRWFLTISMGFAAAFVVLPWLFLGLGTKFGVLALLPDADAVIPVWNRIALFLVFALTLAVSFFVIKYREYIDIWTVRRLAILLRKEAADNSIRRAFLAICYTLILIIIIFIFYIAGRKLTVVELAFVLCFLITGAVLLTSADPGAVAAAAAISVAGAIGGAGANAGTVATAAAFAAATAFAAASATFVARLVAVAAVIVIALAIPLLALAPSELRLSSSESALYVGLFFTLMPILAAILHWPSWLLCRSLGLNLLNKLDGSRSQQFFALLWHGIVDLMAAAVFLFLLAALLPRAVALFLDVFDSFLGGFEASLWPHLCTAAQDPLNHGLWVSAMLFSSLVPTALHLMFLIGSPMVFWARPHGQVWRERADYLCGDRQEPPQADLPENQSLRKAALDDPNLLRETATKVAWWRIRQTLLLYPAAMLLAVGLLFLLWELIQALTGSLPAWLLLIATGDRAFVDACLPGAL